jgi:hypothetical protein
VYWVVGGVVFAVLAIAVGFIGWSVVKRQGGFEPMSEEELEAEDLDAEDEQPCRRRASRVVSFDIDGTMEFGSRPGPFRGRGAALRPRIHRRRRLRLAPLEPGPLWARCRWSPTSSAASTTAKCAPSSRLINTSMSATPGRCPLRQARQPRSSTSTISSSRCSGSIHSFDSD